MELSGSCCRFKPTVEPRVPGAGGARDVNLGVVSQREAVKAVDLDETNEVQKGEG